MMNYLALTKNWWRTWKTLPVFTWVRAASYYRAGNFIQAQKMYEKGLEKYKGHPAEYCARLDLAYCLFKINEFDEAEKHLRFVVSNYPNLREGYLRLAKLQLWTGHPLDAAWTIRRAIRQIEMDASLIGLFIIAVLENGGPSYLVREVIEGCDKVGNNRDIPDFVAARARLDMIRGNEERGRQELEALSKRVDVSFQALILFAEVLLAEGEITRARRELKRALSAEPENPRVLSLFAEIYLHDGPFYNPQYAVQLATRACQNTNWSSPRCMHILAESYYSVGDKVSALVMASKARKEGTRLLGEYKDVRNLDLLIENLTAGSLA